MLKEIEKYWDVKPPMHADNGNVGSKEWSQSIIDDRYTYASYLKKFMKWDNYRDKTVVEIGCGAGSDAIALAQAGAKLTALDITEKAVDITMIRRGIHNLKFTIRKYDGLRLPLITERFDLVYSCGVLHHTPHMENLISEAWRVLKPGGQLKMMLYHKESLLYYYSILYKNILAGSKESREELLGRYSEFREGCPYTRCFSRVEIADMLGRLGFSEQDIYTDSVVYDDDEGRKLDGNRKFDVEPTSIYDIDNFFTKYNFAVDEGFNLDVFGWHLLVTAIKD